MYEGLLVMSHKNYSENSPPSCCSKASAELKLYQAFIFSVPIFFTFILLLLFYLFYLRRRRVDWSSMRMRTSRLSSNDISRSELGLKKELREMLPIIVFKESFSVKDSQCSVCLGDYQADDRLQQIPACGHTFHMDCIDHWLSSHTTCPLCRVSLLASTKPSTEPPEADNEDETSLPSFSPSWEGTQLTRQFSESSDIIERISETGVGLAESEFDCLVDTERKLRNARNEIATPSAEAPQSPTEADNEDETSLPSCSRSCKDSQCPQQLSESSVKNERISETGVRLEESEVDWVVDNERKLRNARNETDGYRSS